MEKIDQIKDYIAENWSRKRGIFLCLIVEAFLSKEVLDKFGLEQLHLNEYYNQIYCTIILLVWCFTFIYWQQTKIPLTAKNKIGIGLCLDVEQDPQTKKAYDDFVFSLKTLIATDEKFQLVLFPQRIAKEVSGNTQKAIEQAGASRIVMLIHGRIVTRGPDNDKTHHFRLMTVIRHRAFEETLHRRFAYRLLAVMPHIRKFKADHSVEYGDITAAEVTIATKVMISMLGILYGDFNNAEKWLDEAAKSNIANIRVKKLIEEQKNELYSSWIGSCSYSFWNDQNEDYLRQINELWPKYRGDDVGPYYARAMAKVFLEGDINEAERLYDSKTNKKSAIYWYGKAFFAAYRKKLDVAEKYYKIAFVCELEHETIPLECEVFTNAILEQQPEMHWLHFALGLINYRGKKDLTSALREFLLFLEYCKGDGYKKEHILVNIWIDDIQRKLALTENTMNAKPNTVPLMAPV